MSQIDSNIWVKLTRIFGSNLLECSPITRNPRSVFRPVTQLFRSKWLHFFFQCWRPWNFDIIAIAIDGTLYTASPRQWILLQHWWILEDPRGRASSSARDIGAWCSGPPTNPRRRGSAKRRGLSPEPLTLICCCLTIVLWRALWIYF